MASQQSVDGAQVDHHVGPYVELLSLRRRTGGPS
jgi:hypothetical protein